MLAEVPGGGALPWARLSAIKWSLCKESMYDAGIWRVDSFSFFFFVIAPKRAITVDVSVRVCESIHHNIVCPRASFSHTGIAEIVLTVAYTVTQTCLYKILYTQTRQTYTHSTQNKSPAV